jgi:hypothetical protein
MRRRWPLVVVVAGAVAGVAAFGLTRPARPLMPSLAHMVELGRFPVLCANGMAVIVAYDKPGTLANDADALALYAAPQDLHQRRAVVIVTFAEGSDRVLAVDVDTNRDGVVDEHYDTWNEFVAKWSDDPCKILQEVWRR